MLKAGHSVFKKSARRSDYLSDNGFSGLTEQAAKLNFPLKWCGHRWLENGKCIDRFLDVMSKLFFIIYYLISKLPSYFSCRFEHYFYPV